MHRTLMGSLSFFAFSNRQICIVGRLSTSLQPEVTKIELRVGRRILSCSPAANGAYAFRFNSNRRLHLDSGARPYQPWSVDLLAPLAGNQPSRCRRSPRSGRGLVKAADSLRFHRYSRSGIHSSCTRAETIVDHQLGDSRFHPRRRRSHDDFPHGGSPAGTRASEHFLDSGREHPPGSKFLH